MAEPASDFAELIRALVADLHEATARERLAPHVQRFVADLEHALREYDLRAGQGVHA